MDWLAKYWWILVIVFLVGVLLNVIKDLKRVDHKKFLANKPELPRIVISTISGTMTTTGRKRINRRSVKWPDKALTPHPAMIPDTVLSDLPGYYYIISITSSSPGLPPLSASSK